MIHHWRQLKAEFDKRQRSAQPQQIAGKPTYADKVHAATKDHAKDILWNHMSVHGGITKAAAADGWDAYFNATSAEDLAKRLQSLPLPDVTKHELYLSFKEHREKPKTTTYRDHIENAVNVVKRVASMQNSKSKDGVSHLEAFEKRPNILKAIGSAIGIDKKDNNE